MNRTLNPFDDEQGTYIVLTNDSGQHSLWPAGVIVPSGWTTVHGEDTRAASLAYVDQHWTALRAGRPQPGPRPRQAGKPS